MKTNSYICILKRKHGTPRLKGRKSSFNAREANQFQRNKLQRKRNTAASKPKNASVSNLDLHFNFYYIAMSGTQKNEFDVIVIGGGITGAGTARDCSLRGLKVLLIERHDIADGATGRNHGLLHSGARYAVTDQESAAECIQENMILKKIANHCVDDTSGFFITLPEDDLAYQAKFVESCTKAGIKAEVIDPKEAIRLEQSVNPDIMAP